MARAGRYHRLYTNQFVEDRSQAMLTAGTEGATDAEGSSSDA